MKENFNFKKEENLSKILFIVISKSGSTVETISNFFSLKIFKKKTKNIFLISEKKNNLLFSLSKKFNLFYVEHRANIGGRYSVLSEVGIIPTYLMGINIINLRSKILDWLKKKNKKSLKNSVTKIANLINSKNFSSLILLNYFQNLKNFYIGFNNLLLRA